MEKRKNKRIKITIMAICFCIMANRPAVAQFIPWPVENIASIASFAQGISGRIDEVMAIKAKIENATQIISSVGDTVSSQLKYVADLKNEISSINLSKVLKITVNVATMASRNAQSLKKMSDNIKEMRDNAEKLSTALVNDTGSAIDDGASEDEVQNIIEDAEVESGQDRQKMNEIFDTTLKEIKQFADENIDSLKELAEDIQNSQELTEDEKKDYINQIDELINRIEAYTNKLEKIIQNAKEQYNSDYENVLLPAFDNYSKAISDYYAGKISKEELEKASNELKEAMTSIQTEIDADVLTQFADEMDEINDLVSDLKESLLNRLGNNKEYTDDDEVPTKSNDGYKSSSNTYTSSVNLKYYKSPAEKYTFNYIVYQDNNLAKSVYLPKNGKNKSFVVSKELMCSKMNENKLKELDKNVDDFKECVTKAKTEKEYFCPQDPESKNCKPFKAENGLYKKYEKNGVYKHMMEDYAVANIANNAKIKQYIITWRDLDDSESTARKLQDMNNIEDTSNAFRFLGLVDIESTKLWSMLRRVDTLHRAKNEIQQFASVGTLYLDGRDDDYIKATEDNRGELTDEIVGKGSTNTKIRVFSNVFLYNCDLKADDISVRVDEKSDDTKIEKVENNIAKCLLKYAEASGKGSINGNLIFASNRSEGMKQWQEKQIKTINDSSFDTLVLSTINNYKSLKENEKAEGDETSILSLEAGLQNATTAMDGYSADAEISYYTAQQILSVVDAEAQSLQTDILKDLVNFNYNYFPDQTGIGD